MERKGEWVGVAFLGFLAAYIAVESYYAGQRSATLDSNVLAASDLPTDNSGEDESHSESQPEDAE